jgi:hypothetical protein
MADKHPWEKGHKHAHFYDLFQATPKRFGLSSVPTRSAKPKLRDTYGPLDLVKDAYKKLPVPEQRAHSHYHNQLQRAQGGLKNDLTPAQLKRAKVRKR